MTTIGNDVPDFTVALSGFVCLSSPAFSVTLPPSLLFLSSQFLSLFSPPFSLSGSRILGVYQFDEVTSTVRPPTKISRTFEKYIFKF